MKRRHRFSGCILLTLMIFLIPVLTGCGGDPKTPVQTDSPSTTVPNMVEEDSGNEAQHDSASPEGDMVTVDSIEELLEAVAPHTGILLKPGYYNMSEYIEYVWAQEGERWNEKHPYVQLRNCYDGVEVVIQRVDGLSICGDNKNLTEIVVDPRYAQVLNFEECHDLTLSGLTMGHTETGACSGNVLDFRSCRNIRLSAMDIYGCGVYGIGCYDGTGELYVYSSTIRDCAYGALKILDGNGRFEFHNCGLTGSEARDWYEPTPYSELAFYECVFGENETSYYMFLEDIYTEDCVWSETYTYPEYGYEDWLVFAPESMERATVGKDFFYDNTWFGYALVNPESAETVMIPYEEADGSYVSVTLQLYEDGTGQYESGEEVNTITWRYTEDLSVCITFKDGRNYYITPFTMGGEDYIWLLMEREDGMVWLY